MTKYLLGLIVRTLFYFVMFLLGVITSSGNALILAFIIAMVELPFHILVKKYDKQGQAFGDKLAQMVPDGYNGLYLLFTLFASVLFSGFALRFEIMVVSKLFATIVIENFVLMYVGWLLSLVLSGTFIKLTGKSEKPKRKKKR